MPYKPKNKNPKPKMPKEQLNLDLGRLQPPEYVTPTKAKSMVREFLDVDASMFFGIGPDTKRKLDKQGITSVGQVLNQIKGYKDPMHSDVYRALNPQAKAQVQEMLKHPLIMEALKNYKGPLGPRKTETASTKHRTHRRQPQHSLSWWRRLLKALHIIS